MRITPLEARIGHKIGNADTPFTRARLEAYQLEKLNETLALARTHAPFYRTRLADIPSSLASLNELERVPFTTPLELRDQPLQFLCTSQDEIHRVVTLDTSGTTGAPKRIYFTLADQELTVDFFQTGMSTFTAAGDRVLILLPGARPGSVGDLLARALERMGAHGIKHGPGQAEAHTLEVMAQERVNGMVGTPTQALALARTPGASELRLKSVLLSTDHVPNAIVRVVEDAWGCTVYNHYGMTEMGLGGGVECEARRGYHLREDDLYFEIVDPQTGMPAAKGETGEVVFTTLTRRGMPLIRYRTGDLSHFIPGTCACGTKLKTLARITARRDGIVRVGDAGALTMADLDEAIFPIAGVTNFGATLRRRAPRDHLRIEARVLPGHETRALFEIQQAVQAIPAIRYAVPEPEVTVALASGTQAAGKRTILVTQAPQSAQGQAQE